MITLKLAAIAASAIAAMLGGGIGVASASSAATSATCAGAINWDRAARYVGRVATVRGRVAGTHYASTSNGTPTFLNLGIDYPSSRRFTVVIWGRNRGNFRAPESTYRGRTICVRGLVRSYEGRPEIHASAPSQIALG